MEGSPSQETTRFRSTNKKHGSSDAEECLDVVNTQGPEDISSQIEREFLREVEHAEELAKAIDPGMDSIFRYYLERSSIFFCHTSLARVLMTCKIKCFSAFIM